MMRRKTRVCTYGLKMLALLTISFLFLVSCGQKKMNRKIYHNDQLTSQIIIGDVDWKGIRTVPLTDPVRIASKSVGIVYLPKLRSRCTGFLIANNFVMTNQHCVPSESYAEGIEVSFNKEGGPEPEVKYNCSEFIGNHSQLDFALLRCEGNPGQTYGTVELADSDLAASLIYIVQQNCDYYMDRGCTPNKIVSYGEVTDKNNSSQEYTHNADTLGGSSGSPVFAKSDNKVVAIHHAGKGNNGLGRGVENYAVPMHKIREVIESDYPGLLDDEPTEPSQDFEPNESLSAAKTLSVASTQLEIKKGDKDFFKFSVAKAGKRSIDISFTHSVGDLDLKVYSSNGSVVAKSESTTNSENVSLDVQPGEYFVEVFGYRGAIGKYTLVNSFEASSILNNSMESAMKVFAPHTSNEELKSSDNKDYFFFEVDESKNVLVEIKFSHSQGDLDLFLLDETGKKIKYSNGVSDTESMIMTLPKGKYFVLIEGYREAIGKYSLKVN